MRSGATWEPARPERSRAGDSVTLPILLVRERGARAARPALPVVPQRVRRGEVPAPARARVSRLRPARPPSSPAQNDADEVRWRVPGRRSTGTRADLTESRRTMRIGLHGRSRPRHRQGLARPRRARELLDAYQRGDWTELRSFYHEDALLCTQAAYQRVVGPDEVVSIFADLEGTAYSLRQRHPSRSTRAPHSCPRSCATRSSTAAWRTATETG